MNDIRAYFSEISQSFESIDYLKFFLNLIVTAIISIGLSFFYVHFGNATTNRKRFAKNFLPLAMTTMMITATMVAATKWKITRRSSSGARLPSRSVRTSASALAPGSSSAASDSARA